MAYEADNESTQIREIEEKLTILRDIQYEESESVGEENVVGPIYNQLGKFRNNINGIIGGGSLLPLNNTWTGTNLFSGGATFRDGNFFIQNTGDITKQVKFDLSSITTGNVRTFTLPNATTTLAGLGVVSQTWTGTNVFAGNVTLRDTNFFIQQTSDITKQMKFDIAGATTGKVLTLASSHTDNRTLTFPNATTSLAGLGVTSQTWTGTNSFVGNTVVRDTNFFIQQTSDITKQARFDLAGATTGKVLILKSNHTDNRTLTFPNATTTLAGLGVTSQQWTGTNDFFGITKIQDVNFSIYDNSDNTKIAKFECSAITTGTTRTYTLPDDSAGLVTVNTVANFANKNFKDSTCAFINNTDNTKKVLFDLAGITTATTRTLVLPNASTSLAGLGVTLQQWTGTNDFFGITKVKTNNNFLMQEVADNTKQVKWNLTAITTGTTRTITMPDADVTLGAGGISFPIDFPSTDLGTVTTTQTIDFNTTTRHSVKMTIGAASVAIDFSNVSSTTTLEISSITVIQDATGGRAITFVPTVVNSAVIIAAFAASSPSEGISFIVELENGILTAYLKTGNVVSGGGGGATSLNDLSDVTLTSPVTESILIKTAGNWIDGFITNGNIDASAEIAVTKITGTAVNLASSQTLNNKTLTAATNIITGVFGITGLAALVQAVNLNGNDLVFGTGTGEFMDHGGSSNIRLTIASTLRSTWNATGLLMASGYRLTMNDEIRLNGITKPASTVATKIYAENLTNDALVLNAATSGKIRGDIAGTEAFNFTATNGTFTSTVGYSFTFFRNDTTPNDGDNIASLNFQAFNSAALGKIYAGIEIISTDVTSGTEDGDIEFKVMNGGTLKTLLTLDGSVAKIQTNGFAIDLNGGDIDDVGQVNRQSPTSITGSRGGNVALANLLTDLASIGLITDNTTA